MVVLMVGSIKKWSLMPGMLTRWRYYRGGRKTGFHCYSYFRPAVYISLVGRSHVIELKFTSDTLWQNTEMSRPFLNS